MTKKNRFAEALKHGRLVRYAGEWTVQTQDGLLTEEKVMTVGTDTLMVWGWWPPMKARAMAGCEADA